MRTLSFVFPVATSAAEASAYRISAIPHGPPTDGTSLRNDAATDAQALAAPLYLAEVEEALTRFFPTRVEKPDWNVTPLSPGELHVDVGGRSAQLAALLELARRRAGGHGDVRLLSGVIWATGRIGFELQRLVLLPTTRGNEAELCAKMVGKLRLFGRLEGDVFLCHRDDYRTAVPLLNETERARMAPLYLDELIARDQGRVGDNAVGVKTVLLLHESDLERLLALVGAHDSGEEQCITLCAVSAAEPIIPVLGKPNHIEASPERTLAVYPRTRMAAEVGLALAAQNIACSLDRMLITWDRVSLPGHVGEWLCAVAKANSASHSCFVPGLALDEVTEIGDLHGYRIGFLPIKHRGLGGAIRETRVDLWALANKEGLRALGLVRQLRFSKAAALVANLVTTFRLVCTAGTILCLYRGSLLFALLWYALGLASDTFDGFVARQFNGTTAGGKAYDAYVDMIHNSASTVAFATYAYIHHFRLVAALSVIGTLAPLAIGRRWIEPDSAAAKIRSGFTRVVIVAAMLPLALRGLGRTSTILILALLAVVTAFAVAHEFGVIRDDIANHGCGYWRRPLYVPPRRDTRLLSLAFDRVRRWLRL